MLFFPYPLFNALKDNIFKEYLANDICFMILYIEGKGISCNCSVKEKIQPEINHATKMGRVLHLNDERKI